MEEMLGKWRSLSLTPDEGEGVNVNADLMEKGHRLMLVGLIGKILTDWLVNKQVFSTTLKKLWRISKGLDINEFYDYQFIFTFEKVEDILRILEMEPWSYNKSLLVLKKFQGATLGVAGPF